MDGVKLIDRPLRPDANSVVTTNRIIGLAMSMEFLTNNYERISYLVNLLTSHATGKSADNGEYQSLRQQLLRDPDIASALPAWLKYHASLESFWNYIQPKFGTYAERRTYLSEQFTPLLDALEHQDAIAASAASPMSASQAALASGSQAQSRPIAQSMLAQPGRVVARNKRKVFIVHGRDNEAKQEVSRFIADLGLEVIILHEQASAGMTIIEKIERYSNDADFALVLYTPCDLGRGAYENNPPNKRARQNVVFEHGYLMAKLGRENVCALVKNDLEKPNDISGVVYVDLDQAGAWKIEVSKELRACGYQLKQWC